MAAVLAHEIRNPLAGIRGAMQVMSARYEPGSKEAWSGRRSSPGSIRSAS